MVITSDGRVIYRKVPVRGGANGGANQVIHVPAQITHHIINTAGNLFTSGLRDGWKFLLRSSSGRTVFRDRLTNRPNIARSYFFYDATTHAIRWIANTDFALTVRGSVRPGAIVTLGRRRNKAALRQ
jgi:hypothetical protein